MNPAVARAMHVIRTVQAALALSLLTVAGCGGDSVVGEWRSDATAGPHGLVGRLTLQESGNASYASHGSSGLGLPFSADGEWIALGAENGVPRYELRLGCRPPGTLDPSGHCSSEAWRRSTCTLEKEQLSCPDGALEGALRFLRAAPDTSQK